MGYHAQITFAFLSLRGKYRRSLEEAVDDHAVLLAAKVRALGAIDDAGVVTPEHVMRDALLQVSQASLECRISVSVPNRYAHYIVGRGLSSPSYSSSVADDVSAALHAWQQFRSASESGYGSSGSGGRGTAFRAPPGAQEVHEKWLSIRAAYLNAWAARGANMECLAAKIDGFMASQAPQRERDWEMHEAAKMGREERRQRAAGAAVARRQSQAASATRASLLASRRAEKAQDRPHRHRCRSRRCTANTPEMKELRCLRRLTSLTGRWPR